MPICKREQTIGSYVQSEVRVSQGEVELEKALDMPISKYTDYAGNPTCPMEYTTTDGGSPSSKATMTITGDKMKVSAPTVNKTTIDAANWSVTKTITVKMQDLV